MRTRILTTVPLRDRLKMYLLVTLACGALALALRVYLLGTGGDANYAEQQLRAATAEPQASLSQTAR